MIIGTPYFVSEGAAYDYYYLSYGIGAYEVQQKLADGEIHLGQPPLQPGDTLTTVDHGRRFAIVTQDA